MIGCAREGHVVSFYGYRVDRLAAASTTGLRSICTPVTRTNLPAPCVVLAAADGTAQRANGLGGGGPLTCRQSAVRLSKQSGRQRRVRPHIDILFRGIHCA